MLFYVYKGFTIYPVPRSIVSSSHWKFELTLRNGSLIKNYSHDGEFNTKSEAVFYCIKYGKQLIDEGIELLDDVI